VRRTDTLIIGGGPAGAAAAILLARGRQPPLLIERRTQLTGVVCGGFLGWDALASLAELGVDAGALGAVPIGRLRLVAGACGMETNLPGRAAGLSRCRLDEAMLDLAVREGVDVLLGRTVRRLDGKTAELDDGTCIEADRLIIATGKHALRGAPRNGPAGVVGLRASVPAPSALAGHIELHLFRGGYAGLLTQEDGTANLCLSVSPARLREAGGRPEGLLAALVDEAPAIAGLGAAAQVWDTIAGVPYGWHTRTTEPDIYRIGDQAAVIASLAGDGIAIALASGKAAARAILAGADARSWQREFGRRAARPLKRAEAARSVAESTTAAGLAVRLLGQAPWIARMAAKSTRIGT